MLGKIKYRLVLFLKRKIDRHLSKKQEKYLRKYQKQTEFNTWYWQIVTKEKHFPLPLGKRLKMYRHGFKADDYHLYHFEKNDMNQYMSERDRWKTRNVNGEYNLLLDDKMVFFNLFSNKLNIPRNICLLTHRKLIPMEDTFKSMKEVLEHYPKLVIKPVCSGGGAGVHVVEKRQNEYYINLIKSDLKQIDEISQNGEFIVTPFVEQHRYAKEIFPNSTNTIRVIMIRDHYGKVEIPYALHRFGSNQSGCVDNVCSGGYFGLIDVKTGKIGEMTSYGTTDFYTKHPDTKKQITGVQIPRWNKIKKTLTEVMEKMPYLKFVAWDIVVTYDDFVVIEANTSTGIGIIQVFEPLKGTTLGKFYEKNW